VEESTVIVESRVGEGSTVEGPVVFPVAEGPVAVPVADGAVVEEPVAAAEPGADAPTIEEVEADPVDGDVAHRGPAGGGPDEPDHHAPDPGAPPPDLVVVDEDTPADQAGSVREPPPADQSPRLASVRGGDVTTATTPVSAPATTPARGAATATAADADDPERRHPWRTVARTAAWTTAILAVAVVLLVFVFPTRTYLSQRRQLTSAANQLQVLDQQNAQLTAQVARLQTDGEIERLAREQYHLVRPGERAFAILPAPAPPTPATPAPPVRKSSGGWVHRLTSWIP
jgi:cell division protein FtsB